MDYYVTSEAGVCLRSWPPEGFCYLVLITTKPCRSACRRSMASAAEAPDTLKNTHHQREEGGSGGEM